MCPSAHIRLSVYVYVLFVSVRPFMPVCLFVPVCLFMSVLSVSVVCPFASFVHFIHLSFHLCVFRLSSCLSLLSVWPCRLSFHVICLCCLSVHVVCLCCLSVCLCSCRISVYSCVRVMSDLSICLCHLFYLSVSLSVSVCLLVSECLYVYIIVTVKS